MDANAIRYEVCPIIGSLKFGAIDQTFTDKTAALQEAAAIINEQPSVSSLQTVAVHGYDKDGKEVFSGTMLRNLFFLTAKDHTHVE